jgi:Uma2 family endonuclease
MATLPADISAPSRHRLTVADYRRMGETGIIAAKDRVELIEGEIIDMSPIGSLHAALVDMVASLLHQHCGRSAIVRNQNPLALDDVSQPQPDITVLKSRQDFYSTAHPGPADVLLVIEVADTSLSFDLGVKVPLYAAHGIPEVWVIDAASRRTHRFRRPEGGRYAEQDVVEPTETLACGGAMAGREPLAGVSLTLGTLLP